MAPVDRVDVNIDQLANDLRHVRRAERGGAEFGSDKDRYQARCRPWHAGGMDTNAAIHRAVAELSVNGDRPTSEAVFAHAGLPHTDDVAIQDLSLIHIS